MSYDEIRCYHIIQKSWSHINKSKASTYELMFYYTRGETYPNLTEGILRM